MGGGKERGKDENEIHRGAQRLQLARVKLHSAVAL